MSNRRIQFVILLIVFVILISFQSRIPQVEAKSTEPFRVHRLEIIRLSSIVVDESGIGVPNQIVSFYDETEDKLIGRNITDINGYCYFLWQIPQNHSLGITYLNTTYNGNSTIFLGPSYSKFTIIVVAKPHIIYNITNSQNISTNMFLPSDFINLNVQLYDEFNNTISKASILIYIDNNVILNYFDTLPLLVKIPLYKYSIGVHNLSIYINESEFLDSSYTTYTFTIYQKPLKIVGDDSYTFHKIVSSNITFQILSGSIPMVNASYSLYLQNGDILINGVSNLSGYISINISKYIHSGYNLLYLKCFINIDYKTAIKQIEIYFYSDVFISNLSISKSVLFNTTSISFNLIDKYGENISMIPLKIYLDSSQLIYSGWYSMNFNISFVVFSYAGYHKISIISENFGFYLSQNMTFSFIVYDYPEYVIDYHGIEGYVSYGQKVSLDFRIFLHTFNLSVLDMYIFNNITNTYSKYPCNDPISYSVDIPNNNFKMKYLYLNFTFINNSDLPIEINRFELIFKIVSKIPTKLKIISLDHTENNILVVLRLKSLNGTYLKSSVVVAKFNSQSYQNVTDSQGYVSFLFEINSGNVNISFLFNGKGAYLPCNTSLTINFSNNLMDQSNYYFLSLFIIIPLFIVSILFHKNNIEIIEK